MTKRTSGLTLIELLVVMAILAVLAALIYPTIMSSRRRADDAVCISNLRQIGQAFSMYLEDYRDRPPRLDHLAPAYVSSPELFICPADPYVERGGWAWDIWGKEYTPFEAQPFPVSFLYPWYRNPDLRRWEWTWAQARSDAGYACCVVHGEPVTHPRWEPQRLGGLAIPYEGLVHRLGFDGRVFKARTASRNGLLGFGSMCFGASPPRDPPS